jgi:hypothetical protein
LGRFQLSAVSFQQENSIAANLTPGADYAWPRATLTKRKFRRADG